MSHKRGSTYICFDFIFDTTDTTFVVIWLIYIILRGGGINLKIGQKWLDATTSEHIMSFKFVKKTIYFLFGEQQKGWLKKIKNLDKTVSYFGTK